jgi:hypothetical protein
MKYSSSLAVLSWLGLLARQGSAQDIPTWPASTDELEDMMFLNSGFRKSGFGEQVIPCQKTNVGLPGSRMSSAEWVRTAFHDMATANVFSGTGGLDASILYETGRTENVGAAFETTLSNFSPFYSTRASLADLIALGVYSATRSCGGPVVAIRAGRPDANQAGPTGVPDPRQTFDQISSAFFNFGFNTQDMIAVTACGHSIGGVHTEDFPAVVPPGSNPPFDYTEMDSTMGNFDNTIAHEWLAGTTKNPLAVGPSVAAGQNSDGKIFGADGNVTMQVLTDPTTFMTTCASVFKRMVEVVPNGVQLTPAIQPYEVKPAELQLTLLAGGTQIQFDGYIRVRTTNRPESGIAAVQLSYKDRNGQVSANNIINTIVAGEAQGFDDTFTVRPQPLLPFPLSSSPSFFPNLFT